jgi:hypothetical protein
MYTNVIIKEMCWGNPWKWLAERQGSAEQFQYHRSGLNRRRYSAKQLRTNNTSIFPRALFFSPLSQVECVLIQQLLHCRKPERVENSSAATEKDKTLPEKQRQESADRGWQLRSKAANARIRHDRQCARNGSLRRVRVTVVAVEKQ